MHTQKVHGVDIEPAVSGISMSSNGQTAQPPEAKTLDLARLGDGLPALTPAGGRQLAEACAVCLEQWGHNRGLFLDVTVARVPHCRRVQSLGRRGGTEFFQTEPAWWNQGTQSP
ncbi:hypothetical protein BH23PLA1_BH23PLA1_26710 [soil metagenome]